MKIRKLLKKYVAAVLCLGMLFNMDFAPFSTAYAESQEDELSAFGETAGGYHYEIQITKDANTRKYKLRPEWEGRVGISEILADFRIFPVDSIGVCRVVPEEGGLYLEPDDTGYYLVISDSVGSQYTLLIQYYRSPEARERQESETVSFNITCDQKQYFDVGLDAKNGTPVATSSVPVQPGKDYAVVQRPVNPVKAGYHLSENGWYYLSDNEEKTAFIFAGSEEPDPTQVVSDITLYADWIADQYTIWYDLDGGSVTPENPTSYTIETDDFTLHQPTKAGFEFIGWTGTNIPTTSPQKTVTIGKGSTGDKNYKANWTSTEETPYTVEHYTENAADAQYTLKDTDHLTATAGASVTPPVKSYEGFTAPAVQTVTVAADGTTKVAYQYTRNTYQITYNMNGHGTQIDSTSAKYGAGINAPTAPTAEGYIFGGWYTEAACTNAYTFTTMPLGGVTVYAKWTAALPGQLAESDTWYKGSTAKSAITSIRITKGSDGKPDSFAESWDASATGDGSVMAYVEADGKLTITGNGRGIAFGSDAHNAFREFTNVTAITGLDNIDTSKAENFRCMFAKDEKLTSLDITSWDLSEAETLGYMFYGDSSLTGVKFPQKKTGASKGKLKSLRSLFYGCASLKDENIIVLDTSGVTDMRNLLYGCSSLYAVDFTDLDTGSVKDMAGMFCGCSSMVFCQLEGDTSSVQDMSYMFAGTSALSSVSLPKGADMSSVRNMSCMFLNAGAKEITLSGTCVYSKVEDTSFMFYGCSKLEQINSGNDLWTGSNSTITKDTNMFAKCVNLKGENGTKYTSTHAGKRYARVDTKLRMGYLSQDFD